MQVRDLSNHRSGVLELNKGVLELGPRVAVLVEPDPSGQPVRIELDLAIEFDDNLVGLLTGSHLLAEMGLDLAVRVDVITCNHPVRPLAIWVLPPAEPVSLEPEMSIALLSFVPTMIPRGLYHDPSLDIGEEDDDHRQDPGFSFIGLNE